MYNIPELIAIIALILALVYSSKSKKEKTKEKQKNYRLGANVWGVIFVITAALTMVMYFNK